MPDHDGNVSNPYKPNAEWCCEACVFKTGTHASWCDVLKQSAADMVEAKMAHLRPLHPELPEKELFWLAVDSIEE